MIDYETEIRELMQGLVLCAGCEEEWVAMPEGAVLGNPVYCAFCEIVPRALEHEYQQIAQEKIAAAPRMWDALPRVDIGTVPIGQLMRPVTPARARKAARKPKMGRIVLVAAAALASSGAVLSALYLLTRWAARLAVAR